VRLNSLKSLNLTNGYPNNNKNNNSNNKVKSKPLELYELAGKKIPSNKVLAFLGAAAPPAGICEFRNCIF
jgi:hypothetical protein